MKKRRFGCPKCKKTFEIEIYESGEAEQKRVRTAPVRCPVCGGFVEPC